MTRTIILPQLVFSVLCSAIVAPAWHRAGAQDPNYIVTKGYPELVAAVSRLQRDGAILKATLRQELIDEGLSLIQVEESYVPGTTPIQQEIKRAEQKSSDLAVEARELATWRAQLEADPNRTQAQIDSYETARNNLIARDSAHATYWIDLESRIDADTLRLENLFAAFNERVNTAFAEASSAKPSTPNNVPIDRIVVPSPEIAAKQYVQLDLQPWSDNVKPLVAASNKALRQVQDTVDETVTDAVIDELKNRATKTFEYVPGYETVKSIKDRLEMLNDGYSKPTLELFRSAMDDIRRTVGRVSDPNDDGSFADSQSDSAQRRHEKAQHAYEKLGWDIFKDDLENAAERENAWIRDRDEEKPRVVPIEKKVPHPDASRWLPRKK